MKTTKRIAASVTALMLLVSGAFSTISPATINASTVTTNATETDYDTYSFYFKVGDISIASEADFNSLKKVSEYREAYTDGKINPGLSGMEERKVIEVPVIVKKNTGFLTSFMELVLSPELTMVGFKQRESGSVETFEKSTLGTNENKAMFRGNETSNITQTGTIFTVLVALPEKYGEGSSYCITIDDKTFELAKASLSSVWKCNIEKGTVTVGKKSPISDSDYQLEIEKTEKEVLSLKTVSQYPNAYKDKDMKGELEDEYKQYKDNKVVEVPVNMLVNAGVNTGSIIFEFAPELKLLGCLNNEKGSIATLNDAKVSFGIKTQKLLINCEYRKNCVTTGTLATLLFILPSGVKPEEKYAVGFAENGFNFESAIPFGGVAKGTNGYVMIKDSVDPSDPPKVTTPTVTTVVDTEKPTESKPNTTAQVPKTEVTTSAPLSTLKPVTTAIQTTAETKPVTTLETKPVTTLETKPVTTLETKPVTTPETKPITTTKAATVTESPVTTVTEPIKTTTPTTTVVETTKPNDTPKDIEIPFVTDISNLKDDRVVEDEKVDIKEAPVVVKIGSQSVVKGAEYAEHSVVLKDYKADSYFHEIAAEIIPGEWFTVDSNYLEINPEIKTTSTKSEITGNTIYIYGIDTTKLSANAELFKFRLKLKENTPVGSYDITAKVSANRAVNYIVENGVKKAVYKGLSDVTSEGGKLAVTEKTIKEKKLVKESFKTTTASTKFYYSHDTKFDKPEDLKVTADVITVYNDGTESKPETIDITSKVKIKDGATPAKTYDKTKFAYKVALEYIDAEVAPKGVTFDGFTVLIGQLGDITLNHEVDVVDTTIILKEAAKNVIGDTILDDTLEKTKDDFKDDMYTTIDKETLINFMHFLGDVYADGELDVVDGTLILKYAVAFTVSDGKLDVAEKWSELLKKK